MKAAALWLYISSDAYFLSYSETFQLYLLASYCMKDDCNWWVGKDLYQDNHGLLWSIAWNSAK
jgi:hypothetical protein